MPDDNRLQRPGPSMDQKEEVVKFLLTVIARFKDFKKRVPSMTNDPGVRLSSRNKTNEVRVFITAVPIIQLSLHDASGFLCVCV
jgi:hypothetical protein